MKDNYLRLILQLLVLHFKCVDLPVVVGYLVLVDHLLLFERVVVLGEQPLCLVMDEVAEDLKAVALFNGLLLEQLSHDSDPLSDVIKLLVLLLDASVGIVELSLFLFKLFVIRHLLILFESCEPFTKHRDLRFQDLVLLLKNANAMGIRSHGLLI